MNSIEKRKDSVSVNDLKANIPYKEKIREQVNSIHYKPKLFTVGFDDEKYVLGAVLKDQPGFQKLFSCNTIYESIVDIDRKIKHSILLGIQCAEIPGNSDWDPFKEPSDTEWEALYYMENALYRVSVLWDLLAQLFNLKEDFGISSEKIYAEQLFHNAQQGKKPNVFAKKVYAYMKQEDDCSSDPCKGNYAYLKEYRDKMTHRYAPSISTISDYAVDLRLPAIYSLYRITEDYIQVSSFIQELLDDITHTATNSIDNSSEDSVND